jgi:hypothetical protein
MTNTTIAVVAMAIRLSICRLAFYIDAIFSWVIEFRLDQLRLPFCIVEPAANAKHILPSLQAPTYAAAAGSKEKKTDKKTKKIQK